MINETENKIIKKTVDEFFSKTTIAVLKTDISLTFKEDVIDLNIELEEPQILIGQGGQTLFEIQRLLKTILNKKLNTALGTSKVFYLNLDINNYKKKKVEYLKGVAKDLADQVSLNKEEKALLPMSSYERRIIHAELSQRSDVITESQGEGFDRHIVIKPK